MTAALRSGVDELPEAGGRTGGETHLAIDDPDLLSGEQDAHAGALTRPGDRNGVLDAVLSGLGLLGLGRDPLDLDGVQEIGIQVKQRRGAGRGLRGEVDGELTRCRVTLKAFVLDLKQALGGPEPCPNSADHWRKDRPGRSGAAGPWRPSPPAGSATCAPGAAFPPGSEARWPDPLAVAGPALLRYGGDLRSSAPLIAAL